MSVDHLGITYDRYGRDSIFVGGSNVTHGIIVLNINT